MSASQSSRTRSSRGLLLTGPILFVSALALYVFTSGQAAYPGYPAVLAARHTGTIPFAPQTNGVWELITALLASLGIGTLAGRLAFFSAVCGAGCVWLMYELHIRVRHDKTREEVLAVFSPVRAQWFTGVVAAMALAISVPFWVVSNRPYTLPFDVLLLLSSAFLLQVYDRNRKSSCLWASAFLYGVGMAEFPTLVLLLPLYTTYLLIAVLSGGPEVSSRSATMIANLEATFRPGKRPWRSQLLAAFLLSVLGFCVLFLLAFRFWKSPVADWAGTASYGDAVLHLMRQHYVSVAHVVPKTGWLLIGLTAVMPWLAVLNFPKDGQMSREALFGSWAFHAILAGLAVALIANYYFSPWVILQGRPWIVVPYVLIASWTGYLAGYGYIVLFHGRRTSSQARSSLASSGKAWLARLRPVYIAVVLGGLVAAATANFRLTNARQGDFLQTYAGIVADHLGERTWIIGGGPVLNNLRIELHERNMDALIIDLGLMYSKPYRSYLAGILPDNRLRALVQVGIVPLLAEWFRLDPALTEKLAVIESPELLVAAGQDAVPLGAFYVAGGAQDPAQVETLLADHRSVWPEIEKMIAEVLPRVTDERLQRIAEDLPRSFSKQANNFGVFLEEHGEDAAAVQAYNKARELYPENLSALMNLFAVTKRLDSVQYDEVKAEFEAYLRDQKAPARVWSLAISYGYVRNPLVFRDMGLMWAFSGKRGLAIRELERAAAMEGAGTGIHLALAGLYAEDGQSFESEALYQEILKDNPTGQRALLGLARLSMRTGDAEAARSYLDRLEAADAPESLVQTERASLALLEGNRDEAKTILEALLGVDKKDSEEDMSHLGYFNVGKRPSGKEVDRHGYFARTGEEEQEEKDDPNLIRAISFLALIATEEGDEGEIKKWTEALAGYQESSIAVNFTLAQVARQQGEYIAARGHLDQVLHLQPANQRALETLLNFDVAEGRIDLAERHVQTLLGIDPRHAQANYVLGSIQFERGEIDLAESSFQTSNEVQPSTDVLNSLAWIEVTRSNFAEGLRLSDEALRLDAENGSAWDTKGYALLQMGKLDDAKDALLRAVELTQGSRPSIVLHLASTYGKTGEKALAVQLLNDLELRAAELSDSLRREMGELRASLDGV